MTMTNWAAGGAFGDKERTGLISVLKAIMSDYGVNSCYCSELLKGKCGFCLAHDWLEKPAPAFSSRCPHCDHAVHVGTCLQALRVGKPGEDQFCLCKAASEPTRAAEGQEAAQAESCPVCCSTNRDYACCRGSWHDAQPVAPPTAQARRQFRVGRKVPTHIYDDARPRDVEHFFGEVAACHRTEDAAYLVELTAQARPRATKEQVQNLMMRMGGTYQQAVEALNDELGIEVSE